MRTPIAILLAFSAFELFGFVIADGSNLICPENLEYASCNTHEGVEGFVVVFSNQYIKARPEDIQKDLAQIGAKGPIGQLIFTKLNSENGFSYIPANFLAGNRIAEVSFECLHIHTVVSVPLIFSLDSFKDESTGECLLDGILSIADCNLRQFNGDILKNCSTLKSLTIKDSYVESFPQFPKLEKLENLVINSERPWANKPIDKLEKLSITPELVPSLKRLDLSYNGLLDEDISGLIPGLTSVVRIMLAGNNFSVVPDLKQLYSLDTFIMDLNQLAPELSLSLPNPRKEFPYLKFTINGNDVQETTVTSLQGDFNLTFIDLLVRMTEVLNETVYLKPLSELQLGSWISFLPEPQFSCKCDLAWLLRDNLSLLTRIVNGVCDDGRLFGGLPVEEFSCCSTASLMNHVRELEMEVNQLKAINTELRDKLLRNSVEL